MSLLLVLESELPRMRRKAGVAPMTFNLIAMVYAIVEVIAYTICIEAATATRRHSAGVPFESFRLLP